MSLLMESMEMPERAEHIGAGGYKDAFVVKNDPTKVLLVAKGWGYELNEELRLLEVFESMGFPVLKIHKFGEDAKRKRFLIVDRAICSGKSPATQAQQLTVMETLGPQTMESCEQIEAAFQANKIIIGDFQWLYGTDGRIWVSDPQTYTPYNPADWARSFSKYKFVDLPIAVMKYAAARKAKDPLVEEEYRKYRDHFTAAKVWYHGAKDREDKAREQSEREHWAKQGVVTNRFEWRQIAG